MYDSYLNDSVGMVSIQVLFTIFLITGTYRLVKMNTINNTVHIPDDDKDYEKLLRDIFGTHVQGNIRINESTSSTHKETTDLAPSTTASKKGIVTSSNQILPLNTDIVPFTK